MFNTLLNNDKILIKTKDLPITFTNISVHDVNNIFARYGDKIERIKLEGKRDNYIYLEGLEFFVNYFKRKKITKEELKEVFSFIDKMRIKENEKIIKEIEKDIFSFDIEAENYEATPIDDLQDGILNLLKDFRKEYCKDDVENLKLENSLLKEEVKELNNKLNSIKEGLNNIFFK